MSRQDKATTDRNARILRELVKQPDNKACADCRKNDARWASWNLCSGIHRSMGTHISRVKSIDLDIWTPEQMDSVQKWGNRRANLYWERHLKAGHIPPDHKIESFIRSKYESRRWAMEGPPPSDPSVLDDGSYSAPAPPPVNNASRPSTTTSAPPAAPASLPRAHPLLSRSVKAQPTTAAAPAPAPAPLLDLMADDPTPAPAPAPPASTAQTTAPPTAAPTPAAPGPTAASAPGPTPTAGPPAPSSNIFDLDFRAPTPQTKSASSKADIMSLFSTTQPIQPQSQVQQQQIPATSQPINVASNFFQSSSPAANPYASWGGGITTSSGGITSIPTVQAPVAATIQSMGGWSVQADQAAWGTPAASAPPSSAAPQVSPPISHSQNVYQPQATNSSSLWGSVATDPWATPASASAAPTTQVKKDDPFANIWG